MTEPRQPAPDPTFRLVPSRYPPVQAFESVAAPEDLEAVMELEGWTNDRLVRYRKARLPVSQWVYGRPNASVVMAAFLHAPPDGQRFSGSELGAWYAAATVRTAVAEVAHHLRREAWNTGWSEMRQTYRAYRAQLLGQYLDIRGRYRHTLHHAASYAAGQAFGERCRAAGEAGILYDSVRYRDGTNIVAYHPPNIQAVTQDAHYDLTVPIRGQVRVREIG